ncbi:MAG: WhiB family transcriptional regulator [Pseudonocardia sp.]
MTTACLTWSLATGQGTGVWGGRSEAERRDRGATQREARPGSIIEVQGRAAPSPETTSDRKRVRARPDPVRRR